MVRTQATRTGCRPANRVPMRSVRAPDRGSRTGADRLPDVRVLSASDRVFLMHLGGKIQIRPKLQLRTRNALSMAYTPGVARVSRSLEVGPATS